MVNVAWLCYRKFNVNLLAASTPTPRHKKPAPEIPVRATLAIYASLEILTHYAVPCQRALSPYW